MLVLRPTKRLRTALGVAAAPMPVASTGRLGDWYVNDVNLRSGAVAVFVNAGTKLVVIVPATGVLELARNFGRRLGALLDVLGVPDEAIAAELAQSEPLVFATATNRSVIGSMNDICWHVFAADEDRQIRTEAYLLDVERYLSGMPHVKMTPSMPDRAVRAILGGSDPELH